MSRVTSTAFLSVLLSGLVLLGACQSTPKEASDAVSALQKMSGATEIGISYQEYSSRMIDLKADVDRGIAKLPEGELKKELTLALEGYVDALTFWSRYSDVNFVMVGDEPAITLQKKYSIEPGTHGMPGLINRKEAVGTIWAAAATHVTRASQWARQH